MKGGEGNYLIKLNSYLGHAEVNATWDIPTVLDWEP